MKINIVALIALTLSVMASGCSKKPSEEMREFLTKQVQLSNDEVQTVLKKFNARSEKDQKSELAKAKADFVMDKNGFRKEIKHKLRQNKIDSAKMQYMKEITLLTSYPELEKRVYEKVITKLISSGAESMINGTLEQYKSTFKESKELPANLQKQTLENMLKML